LVAFDNRPVQDEVTVWQQRAAMVMAVVLASGAAVLHFAPQEASGGATWVSGSMAKVAVLCAALWMALPQLKRLARTTSGPPILWGLGILAAVLVVRPRAIFAIGPLVIAALGVLVTLRHASKWFR
jgi:hypothetical protein